MTAQKLSNLGSPPLNRAKKQQFSMPEPSWTEARNLLKTLRLFGSGHLDQHEPGLVQRSTHLIGWTALNHAEPNCG
jgi:hypothetical protein